MLLAVAAPGRAEAALRAQSPYAGLYPDTVHAPLDYRSAGPWTRSSLVPESAAPTGLVRKKRAPFWQLVGIPLIGAGATVVGASATVGAALYSSRCSWNPLSRSFRKCKN